MNEPATETLNRLRLGVSDLRHRIKPNQFSFVTTAEVEPLVGTVGQERALEALEDGLTMRMAGYNIYACGRIGTGRNSTIRARVEDRAKKFSTPDDWVYVYNFDNPEEPRALKLPAGKGRELADDMEELIADCRQEIPKAFESEEHARNQTSTANRLKEKQNQMLRELDAKAQKELDHKVQATPQGIAAIPLQDGEPLSQEKFDGLDEDKKEELREKGRKLQAMIAETMSQAKRFEKEIKEETRQQDRTTALTAVGHLVRNMKDKYQDLQYVNQYIDAVQNDIIDNLGVFQQPEGQSQQIFGFMQDSPEQHFIRYKVNLVVDHRDTEGAPIIDERNPTYYNLMGQLEYQAQFGGMSTNFNMIRAGALQKASGGFLILQILDVLRNPFAWEGLKRTLRTGRAKIENMWADYQAVPAATLKPEAIPIELKVILVGSPLLYQLLQYLDEDFPRLFKIKADFDTEMDLTEDHLDKYAAFIRSRCEEGGIPPFSREAVARVAEEGARMAGHKNRLSACFLGIADLISEAGHRAVLRDGAEQVDAEDVQAAVRAHQRRSRLTQDKLQRLIEEDTIIIDTEDSQAGQVNGLSVIDSGDYRFGRPSRISCVTAVGSSGVVNIERESKMSGSIHDKGVMIMSGFVAHWFGQDKPLALRASICFEQSYSGVDGDSASCAELYALLSALSGLPLRQDIAVTGSINQRGQVQPIGGVNEKIEGYYEICRIKGLTGRQGVLIPARNIRNLMLNDEVLQAVAKDEFNIYAVDTVEQGVEIMTGIPAGSKGPDGEYPENSVFGTVDRRLRDMANVLKAFSKPDQSGQ